MLSAIVKKEVILADNQTAVIPTYLERFTLLARRTPAIFFYDYNQRLVVQTAVFRGNYNQFGCL